MEKGLQNPDLNLKQLYDQAGEAMPDFAEFGQNFLQYLQDKYPEQFTGIEFQSAPLKDLERIQDKIIGDYGGSHTRISDMVRGRLLVETPEQIQIIRDEIAALKETLGIVKVKDFYAEPLETHFRTLNTQVRLPNGHVAEFRVDQHDMAIAGEKAHKLYEEIQAIERTAKAENRPLTEDEMVRRNELYEQQQAIFHDPAQKNNLDSLLNENGAAMLEANRDSRLQSLAETFSNLGKSGGFVAGVAFGTLSGMFTLAAGGSKTEAAEVTYEAAVPYGETSLDLLDNDMEATARSATIETASNLGSLGGAVAGAATGAAIGSVVPAVGTTIGGVVGGVAGAIGGGVGAGYITEKVYANFAAIKGGVIEVSQDAMHTLSAAAQAAKSVFGDTWDWVTGHDKPSMHLTAVFNKLPNTVTDDMPPEVQSLIEVKANSDLFARQYEDLKAQGGLEVVAKYMADNPSPPEIAHTYDNRTAQQGIYTPGMNM